ncbi:hypothetical protein GN244_ATG00650 [Phytophthora infestans]|uniref:BED-type domain-containing protein n=1 Tax=Phytophthora infestans TaxID=4787 RepID=A0A833WND4_PHYIN|nr:hypothetical protein GN244_ATG00650 [Phytophthora infestans]KAF4132231.1 hypothetical protein GN958_ATG18566 [Phytophthora infestans]KAF4145240.1 hypothetical protein GN958_ATG05542 [Phytophthora infestans]
MAGGGQRYAVWEYFDRIAGTKDVKCKKCFELIPNAKVAKLDRHILRACDLWTEVGRNAFRRAAVQGRQPTRNRVRRDIGSSSIMTQEKLNDLVVDFIYSAGLPSHTVMQPSFAALVLAGRPWLSVPSVEYVRCRRSEWIQNNCRLTFMAFHSINRR